MEVSPIAAADKPNVIIFLADDLGNADIGVNAVHSPLEATEKYERSTRYHGQETQDIFRRDREI